MNKYKRRDIYESTYNQVMEWVNKKKKEDKYYFKSPNRKDNFCYYLEKYIEEHLIKER